MKNILIALLFSLSAIPASASVKLKIIATTSDVASIVAEVAKDKATVMSIAKGTQDPHYIEAKPSYMVNLRDADLVVANGLSLEVGWLPSLIRGARNPKIQLGEKGFLDLGESADPLELPTGAITRAMGDVHPDGNPHFTLDPVRVGKLALEVAKRLGELDAEHKDLFLSQAQEFQKRLDKKTEDWTARIQKSKVKKVITYHSSLNYFLNRFQLTSPTNIENKPGVPPSGQHILNVMATMKDQKINLILVDNFFDTKIADRIAKEVPGAKVKSVGVAVGSLPELKNIEAVIEQLVKVIEGKGG